MILYNKFYRIFLFTSFSTFYFELTNEWKIVDFYYRGIYLPEYPLGNGYWGKKLKGKGQSRANKIRKGRKKEKRLIKGKGALKMLRCRVLLGMQCRYNNAQCTHCTQWAQWHCFCYDKSYKNLLANEFASNM